MQVAEVICLDPAIGAISKGMIAFFIVSNIF